MPDYWVDGPYAPIQTMMAGPSQILSYGKTVTVSGASTVSNYDDLSVLTDGHVKSVVKLNAAGTFIVDLASNVLPNIVALLNHNFTSVRIRFSASAALTSPVIDQTFATTKRAAYLDLRSFTFGAARYMGITPGNSNPILAEIVIATAVLFDGPLLSLSMDEYSPQMLKPTPFGVIEVVRSGVLHRTLQAVFEFASDVDTFTDILEECSLQDRNFLFVPESRVQEVFWIEWLETYDKGITNALTTPFGAFNLLEEAYSVIQ